MKQEVENLIRTGQLKKAATILKNVRISRLTRSEALEFAKLATRVGLWQLSLKALRPSLRGDQIRHQANDAEKIQYASALRKLGAVTEAIDILKTIDSHKNPEAQLNLAFCYSTLWQYNLVIPTLRQYLTMVDTNSYSATVAKVNLLDALISEDKLHEAEPLSLELKNSLKESEAALLLGNVYELSAQLMLKLDDWDAAINSLEKASKLLQHAENSLPALYIEKWMAIAHSLKKGAATESLVEVRDRSIQLNQWETFRDCEYYLAKLSGHETKLLHLYFGTPFDSFRKRIIETLGGPEKIPDSYLYSGGSNPDTIFDLSTAMSEDQKHSLPAGQALHRLWIILSQDFYKPFPVISLFAKLFPGDYYDPTTSPNRAHQIMKRLRAWWKKENLPFAIEESEGNYRLIMHPSVAIRIPKQPLPLDSAELELYRFHILMKKNEFTAKEAAQTLSMSRSETHRLLQEAEKRGLIELVGFTKNAAYRKKSHK